jgi:hypothetical protein
MYPRRDGDDWRDLSPATLDRQLRASGYAGRSQFDAKLHGPAQNEILIMVVVRQTRSELEQHLEEQLQFLEASADAFDAGREAEAKRLALTLRVLLHTAKSHSLLSQLGLEDKPFYDSARMREYGNLNKQLHSLVVARVPVPGSGAAGPDYVAMLDWQLAPADRWLPFPTWWRNEVLDGGEGVSMSRRDLVLTVANKDGGGHVDPEVPTSYARLTRWNAMGWEAVAQGQRRPLEGPHLASIRQITHEVLKTLRPGYRRVRAPEAAAYYGEPLILPSRGGSTRGGGPPSHGNRQRRGSS